MSLPSGYFFQNGAFWKTDGTGPYKYDGATMTLMPLGSQTPSTAAVVGYYRTGFFTRDEAGPQVES